MEIRFVGSLGGDLVEVDHGVHIGSRGEDVKGVIVVVHARISDEGTTRSLGASDPSKRDSEGLLRG